MNRHVFGHFTQRIAIFCSIGGCYFRSYHRLAEFTFRRSIEIRYYLVDNLQYELVEERTRFLELIDHLGSFSRLGVDFEGEWNLHRYGLHLCLIQISDGENIFLLDPTSVGDLAPFLELMEALEIEIVSHGPQSDIVLMDYLFGRTPRNVFDTEKAAQLLNYESSSLSNLLDRHFGISKNMKVRVSDWNKRPLTEKMLNYAALDVAFLHQLRENMEGELREVGRFQWQLEECKALEDIRYRKKKHPHLEIQKANKLNRREAHVLKHIFAVRDQIAKQLDKPAYYIIPNAKLLELAQDPPRNVRAWSNLKGVNPRLKRYANEFHAAIQTAQNTDPVEVRRGPAAEMYKGLSKNAYYRLVDKKTQLLGAIRDQIKEAYDIYPMILSMRNLKRVAYGEATLADFRDWQRKILLDTAQDMELDISILMEPENPLVN